MAQGLDSATIRVQIQSRKSILALYILLGAVLFVVAVAFLYTNPSIFLYLGAILIAFIFYVNVDKAMTSPDSNAMTSLRTILYIFIIVFVGAFIVDVAWTEYVSYTTFLGVLLAISGAFLMNLIITEGGAIHRQSQRVQGGGTQFCPNCGASLVGQTALTYCQKCGHKIT